MSKIKLHPVLAVRFGERLLRERERLGLSQVAMAARLGVSQSHYVSVEGGKRPPSLLLMEKIASKLGKDPGCFLKP